MKSKVFVQRLESALQNSKDFNSESDEMKDVLIDGAHFHTNEDGIVNLEEYRKDLKVILACTTAALDATELAIREEAMTEETVGQ